MEKQLEDGFYFVHDIETHVTTIVSIHNGTNQVFYHADSKPESIAMFNERIKRGEQKLICNIPLPKID